MSDNIIWTVPPGTPPPRKRWVPSSDLIWTALIIMKVAIVIAVFVWGPL